jgi:DNA-directed RNA polymerase specialized sigma subunit
MENHSSISEFEALPRDEVLELLVQCILQLSPTQKTILAMYYHEELEPAEIAACVGLTEGELDQVRTETVGLLRTMLAAQIGLLRGVVLPRT